MLTRDTTESVFKQILQKQKFALSADQVRLVESEALMLYRRHLETCQKAELEPGGLERFVVEIAEQVKRGIYERPLPLTERHDEGCRRLLDAVCVSAERMNRLRAWHQRYVGACREHRIRAYALNLILDAVNSADSTFSLFKASLSEQVNSINALVAAYVQQTGRKDNPRWYASASQKKPSKRFHKYAY